MKVRFALTVLALCLMTAAAAPANPAPDGTWWLNASRHQRDGFYLGTAACQQMLPLATPDVPFRSISSDTTRWYLLHPDRAGEPILAVQARLFARWKREGRYRFSLPQPGDGFNGNWWRVLGDRRRGIILGFLACQQEQLHQPVDIPVRVLVARVNRYYGVTRYGDINNLWRVPLRTAIPYAEQLMR